MADKKTLIERVTEDNDLLTLIESVLDEFNGHLGLVRKGNALVIDRPILGERQVDTVLELTCGLDAGGDYINIDYGATRLKVYEDFEDEFVKIMRYRLAILKG